MRFVMREKIFLSRNEFDTWQNFYLILKDLYEGCENSNTADLICQIQSLLDKLWEEVEGIE